MVQKVILVGFIFAIVKRIIDDKLGKAAKDKVISLLSILGLGYFSTSNLSWKWLTVYLLFVTAHYFYTHSELMKLKKILSPIFVPLLFIFFVKYVSSVWGQSNSNISIYFLGISYVSFKMSLYAHFYKFKEIRAESLFEYFCYVMFLPSLFVGPITKPHVFFSLWRSPEGINCNNVAIFERILVGLVKFTLLSQFFNQTTFTELIPSNQSYEIVHLFISGASYYLFLYFNFSGFCDIVIAIGLLARVDLGENFNRPYISRNIQEFWKRWHITLSDFMNTVVFVPLNLYLMRRVGRKYHSLVTLLCISITFILIGYWHGKDSQYLWFGCLQAFAVGVNFLWGIILKKYLSKKVYRRYFKSKIVYFISFLLSFIYMSFCFVIFGNDLKKLSEIWTSL